MLPLATPAPWFHARTAANPRFAFDTVAGRVLVLHFFGAATDPGVREFLDAVLATREFDDDRAAFFGVTASAEDEQQARVADRLPGVRFFFDTDQAVAKLYATGGRRVSVVLDERLRVVAYLTAEGSAAEHLQRVVEIVRLVARAIPAPAVAAANAPVLVVPRVFEPQLCAELIRYYDQRGGEPSGFMREQDGRTVLRHDARHKQRRDQLIEDEKLRKACMARIHDRLAPEIHKAFQFRATRIERYIVACYDSSSGGWFSPHRDNTTKGTAHRRFAVSLILNTGEFDGGWLRFPEFGRQVYTAPVGGAVVFSCSLLHEATPVTKGKRYAFLPFLYDDDAARIRAENLKFVAKSPTE